MSRFVLKLASSLFSVALVSTVVVGGPATPVAASNDRYATDSVTVGQEPSSVAVNPDGTKVYVANSGEGTVNVINTATNEVSATVRVGRMPAAVAVHPDGSTVYVTNWGEGTVSVINASSNTVSRTIPIGGGPDGVVVHPDGTKAYVTAWNMGEINVIDTSTNTVSQTVGIGGGPGRPAVSPDGTRLYVADSWDDIMRIIDTSTMEVTDTITVGSSPSGVAVNPDGTRVYVSSQDNNGGTVSVIDTSSNTVSTTILVGNSPHGVAVHPDGTRAYVTNVCGDTSAEADSAMLMVIDTSNNTVFDTVPIGDHRPVGIAMNHDGTTLYVSTRDANYETDPSSGASVKSISVSSPQTSTYSSESTSPPSSWWSCSSPPSSLPPSTSPPPTSSSPPPVVSAGPEGTPNQGRTVAGISVLHGSPGMTPMDLGAGLWETFRLVTFSQFRSSFLAGALLASALSVSELYGAIFGSAPGVDTLPVWVLKEMIKPNPANVVNVAGTAVIALSLIAVVISQRQRLRRNNK